MRHKHIAELILLTRVSVRYPRGAPSMSLHAWAHLGLEALMREGLVMKRTKGESTWYALTPRAFERMIRSIG